MKYTARIPNVQHAFTLAARSNPVYSVVGVAAVAAAQRLSALCSQIIGILLVPYHPQLTGALVNLVQDMARQLG